MLIPLAIESTQAYLNYLNNHQLGFDNCQVNWDNQDPTQRYVDGHFCFCYKFSYVGECRIPAGSSVEYLPTGAGEIVPATLVERTNNPPVVTLAFKCEMDLTGGIVRSDLKWLVERVRDWFAQRGHLVSTEDIATGLSAPRFMGLNHLSGEQKRAIVSAMENRFSYTWGPPGSGKTTYVLSSLAKALRKRGRKILIVAPTNNAVDNAMRAVIDELADVLPRVNIARLGTPTPEFLRDYPEVCEDATLQKRLDEISRDIEQYRRQAEMLRLLGQDQAEILILQEKARTLEQEKQEVQKYLLNDDSTLETLKDELLGIRKSDQRLARDEMQLESQIRRLGPLKALLKSGEKKDLESKLAETRGLREENRINREQLEIRLGGLSKQQSTHKEMLTTRDSELSDAYQQIRLAEERRWERLAELGTETIDVDQLLIEIETRTSELEAMRASLEATLTEKYVIGVTLDGFIGRSLSRSFNVDWVIVDEAGYAPLAKTIPLLSLMCPVSMLGDHKQLPPVCEAADEDAVSSSFWAKSALFLESAFLATSHTSLYQQSAPAFVRLVKSNLTKSYRFGADLALLLDHFIYKMNLEGADEVSTKVYVKGVQDSEQGGHHRVAVNEIKAVVTLVQTLLDKGRDNIVVLTPYLEQMKTIRNALRESGLLGQVEVLNTHKAQGREWDTVIFSVVDGSAPSNPYFTNVHREVGSQVLNTTISRVRKELYLVLETGYWEAHENQLLGALALQAKVV